MDAQPIRVSTINVEVYERLRQWARHKVNQTDSSPRGPIVKLEALMGADIEVPDRFVRFACIGRSDMPD